MRSYGKFRADALLLALLISALSLGSTPLAAEDREMRPMEETPISVALDHQANFDVIHLSDASVVREVSAPIGVEKSRADLRSLTAVSRSVSRTGAILRTYNVRELLERQLNFRAPA